MPVTPAIPVRLGCSSIPPALPRPRGPPACRLSRQHLLGGRGNGGRQEILAPVHVAEPQARATLSILGSFSQESCSYMSYEEQAYINDQTAHPVLRDCKRLQALKRWLDQLSSIEDKVSALRTTDKVAAFLSSQHGLQLGALITSLSYDQQYLLLSLPAAGQAHVLEPIREGDIRASVSRLLDKLQQIETFYDSIGGIIGYQLKSLELIAAGLDELRDTQGTVAASAPSLPPTTDSAAPLTSTSADLRYLVPKAVDLAAEDGREVARAATLQGLNSMPHLAEIYPVGGAGDRLGLIDEATGECLPAAMLQYCGRTMLENLLRDLQAREYLYYKLTGQQLTTPVAIMTSDAKGNSRRIMQLMESLRWFGRGRDAFRLFRQPLVPVMSVETGEWLLTDQMAPMMKPGGHGAIWKLMHDEGVFDWLKQQGRTAALVRQISNPMAGMDTTLLALAGVGAMRQASFGFMSCDRHVGAAEGVNVLQERKALKDGKSSYQYNLTNIEYTEFARLGITDEAVEGAPGAAQLSVFPANTNVLYVGLKAAHGIVQQAIDTCSSEQLMPGLIFNLKKKVTYRDPRNNDQERKVQAGRMECTMQNIADFMTDSSETPLSPAEAAEAKLSTFLVYNHRRKVTSSAKKRREPGTTRISQTPDGSFYDLQRNAWHLLQQCGVKHVPELGSVEQYLANGPGFIFLYNPALGPLWDVISQKIQGGSLMQGSELVLEVAEARMHNVTIQGSLLVYAENVVGHMQGPLTVHGLQFGEEGMQMRACIPNELARRHLTQLHDEPVQLQLDSPLAVAGGQLSDADERMVYSSRCGRINLSNVTVANHGIDWTHPDNLYWKHQVSRREAVRVLLQGQSEFEAKDVVITGSHTFSVPDGYRMVVTQGMAGGIDTTLLPLTDGRPSWEWRYSMDTTGSVSLEYKQTANADQALLARQALAVVGASYLSSSISTATAFTALDDEESEYLLDYLVQDVSSWIM